jgi:ADP-ribosylglycohydrolase
MEEAVFGLAWNALTMQRIDRYRGSLLGLAVGDALGTTLEFQAPNSFAPISDIVGGGPFDLLPGQWTDDTSMALCLAVSVTECKGFDALDQMERYRRWYREGYMSCTGRCFDIGLTVQAALRKFEATGQPYCGSVDPMTAGNGSLMRLAPVPLAFAGSPAIAVEKSGQSSATTHGAEEAIDACRYFAALLVKVVEGRDRGDVLSTGPEDSYFGEKPLSRRIADVASGSFMRKQPPAIRGTGYVVDALEAALWAFYHSTSFRDGALLAVNLGNDADTTGAIYGQIGGAFYGVEGIPPGWRAVVYWRELIERSADAVYALSVELGASK